MTTTYTPSGSPVAYTIPGLTDTVDGPAALRAFADSVEALRVIVQGNIDLKAAITDTLLKSLIDAKGDLLAGTADNVAARLAVGSDGYGLVADSAASTGLAWKRRAWEWIADFSAPGSASSIDLDNIFTSNYLTIIEWDCAIAVSSTSLTAQLLASGTPATGANYNSGGYSGALSGQTSGVIGYLSSEGGMGEIHVVKGADAAPTRMFGQSVNGYTSPVPADQGVGHSLSTAYTGLRLASASGSNLTGKFSAYRLKVA